MNYHEDGIDWIYGSIFQDSPMGRKNYGRKPYVNV